MARWILALLVATTTAPQELLPIPDPSLLGMEAAVQEQLSEGLAELRSLIAGGESDAELAEAYGGMGQIYLAYDLVAPAEPCLRNAHRLAPRDFRWPYLLGALFQTARRLDQAVPSYGNALALEPNDIAALIRAGNVHLARDEPEPARAYFERALTASPRRGADETPGPRAAALAGLGKAAAALGEHQAAVGHFEAALAEQPEASSLHYPLAIAYRELGRLDVAALGQVAARVVDPAQLAVGDRQRVV